MYCKNCGNPIDLSQEECARCGTVRGRGSSFCPACGWRHEPGAENCPNCGCGLTPAVQPAAKSKVAAGLLGIFAGAFGIHNFYLGYTGKAWAQLLITVLSVGTLSFISGIWGLVEGILCLTASDATDARDIPLK